MEETAINSDAPADVLAGYVAASDTSLRSTQKLNEAWRRHLEGSAEAPSAEWIAQVLAAQVATDTALDRARAALAARNSAGQPGTGTELKHASAPDMISRRRRRRRESKVLAAIGTPGKRALRATLLLCYAIALLVATAAGISLALEVAGFLHLIEEPVQLPVAMQLGAFAAGAALAYGVKRALEPVERALYGSKGIRPKRYQF